MEPPSILRADKAIYNRAALGLRTIFQIDPIVHETSSVGAVLAMLFYQR